MVFGPVSCLVEVARFLRFCLGQAEAVHGRIAHRMWKLETWAATAVALSAIQRLCISALSGVGQVPCRVTVSRTIFLERSCMER
jgi:hypothetical protein